MGAAESIPNEDHINAAFDLLRRAPRPAIPQQLVTPKGCIRSPLPYVKVPPLERPRWDGTRSSVAMTRSSATRRRQHLTVFGCSQSAIISSLVMDPDNSGLRQHYNVRDRPRIPGQLRADRQQMNPNGFPVPFPGLEPSQPQHPFYGPTPDSFAVANYMLEYDGFADFPQYRGTSGSSLNAAMGIGLSTALTWTSPRSRSRRGHRVADQLPDPEVLRHPHRGPACWRRSGRFR